MRTASRPANRLRRSNREFPEMESREGTQSRKRTIHESAEVERGMTRDSIRKVRFVKSVNQCISQRSTRKIFHEIPQIQSAVEIPQKESPSDLESHRTHGRVAAAMDSSQQGK
jgi:hypothetical protein